MSSKKIHFDNGLKKTHTHKAYILHTGNEILIDIKSNNYFFTYPTKSAKAFGFLYGF